MTQNISQTEDSYKTKQIITIIFLLLTFIKSFFGAIGIALMWSWMKWKIWIKVVITTLYLALFVLPALIILSYLFFMRPVQIKGSTMLPNYKEGEHYISIILNKNSKINRGDVIIFTPPTNPNIDYIKRVIALPSEKIMIQDGNVYVNGVTLDESKYLPAGVRTLEMRGGEMKEEKEIIVPDNSYFVIGDNRGRSVDSLTFGPVSHDLIKSRVAFCYFNCK